MSHEINRSHVGYYNAASQSIPVQDPHEAPCLICGLRWTGDTVRTFSVMPIGERSPAVSIFYRTHRACDDAQTEEQRTELGSRVIGLFDPPKLRVVHDSSVDRPKETP